MNIVIRHDEEGRWWWTALAADGATVATSALYASRADCVRTIAEIKVEGPPAQVTDEDPYAARPGTWRISSLIPSGS